MRGNKPHLRSLAKDQRGTSAVELAVVFPVIIFLLLGAVDIAAGFAAKLQLQQAAARSVELASAGSVDDASIERLKAEAVAASGEDQENVVVERWLECDGARQQGFDGACPGDEQVARFVGVAISGSFSPFFKFLPGTRSDGSIGILGRSSVRVQ